VNPDSTVEVRVVTPGISEGNDTSIDGGLKVDEAVVIDGAEKLQPGSKVRVRGAAPQGHGGSGGGGGRPAGQGASTPGGRPAA
jgi:multidrug efflux system membrane fusion protein